MKYYDNMQQYKIFKNEKRIENMKNNY